MLVRAPSKSLEDCDAVLLPGINLDQFDPARHRIISRASCTTSAPASVVKVLLENAGLRENFFPTVHGYTNSQSLTDQPMRDRRDSWAAAENIIPSSSSTGTPVHLAGAHHRRQVSRVLVRTGSIVELNAVLGRSTTVDELREAFRSAAKEGPLHGVMDVLEEE